ncbi:MAG: DUF3417 domain-containing protein, partial [Anaerolineae bacterium]
MNNFRARSPQSSKPPKRLARLSELAYNLWWTWHPEAARLFGRLNYDLWERLDHNPIVFLREVDPRDYEVALKDKDYLDRYDSIFAEYDAYMSEKQTWAARTHPELTNRPVAYFSMEYGLHETLPIYSGGLGVLAGDHLKEASDLGVPLVGLGIMYAEGYFSQRIGED